MSADACVPLARRLRPCGRGGHVLALRCRSWPVPLRRRTPGRRHRLPRLLAARDARRARRLRRVRAAVGGRGPGAELPATTARRSRRARPVDPLLVLPARDVRGAGAAVLNYGLAKASTLAKHRRLPTWRPLAPAFLVAASVTCSSTQRGWRRWIAAGRPRRRARRWRVRVGRAPGVAPHRAFAALEVCHWSYGVGFWAGRRPHRPATTVRHRPRADR